MEKRTTTPDENLAKDYTGTQTEMLRNLLSRQETPHPLPPLQIKVDVSGNNNAVTGANIDLHKEKHNYFNVDLEKLEQLVLSFKEAKTTATSHLSGQLWGAIPEENPNFIEREKLPLTKLAQIFSDHKAKKLLAITGPAGTGKTQLAKEYVYRNLHCYKQVFWIQAEDTTKIDAAYAKLAEELGFKTERMKAEELNKLVIDWLNKQSKFLMVFDNVPDWQTIKRYIPTSGLGHFLATSVNHQWPTKIPVTTFSETEAREYICKVLGPELTRETTWVDALATSMEYLPIAIAQACAYILNNPSVQDIEMYLILYRAKQAEYMSKKSLPSWEDHESVMITWDMSMNLIRKESLLAAELLTACAYLHRDCIPVNLLNHLVGLNCANQEEKCGEALGVLSKYSMVEVKREKQTASLHGLLQDVIRLRASEEENKQRLNLLISRLVKVFYYSDVLTRDEVKKLIPLLPHVRAVVSHAKQFKVESEDFIFLLLALHNYLFHETSENNSELLDLANEIYIKSDNKNMKLKTLIEYVYGNLWFQRALLESKPEYYAKASSYYLKGLEYNNKEELEPGMAACLYHQMGNCYERVGDYEHAKTLYQKSLELNRKIYDCGIHPHIANNLHELASIYSHAGEHEQALNTIKEAVKIKLQYFGTEKHPSVAVSIDMWGILLQRKGDYLQALQMYSVAAKIYKEFFNEYHLETRLTLERMAHVAKLVPASEIQKLDENDELKKLIMTAKRNDNSKKSSDNGAFTKTIASHCSIQTVVATAPSIANLSFCTCNGVASAIYISNEKHQVERVREAMVEGATPRPVFTLTPGTASAIAEFGQWQVNDQKGSRRTDLGVKSSAIASAQSCAVDETYACKSISTAG